MTETSPELQAAFARIFATHYPDFGNHDGEAETRRWQCEDGWYVEYGTGKAVGGKHDGKYVVLVFKPTGPGARSNKAGRWQRVVFSGYATRKTAKARALAHYYKHSPRKAAAHRWNGKDYS